MWHFSLELLFKCYFSDTCDIEWKKGRIAFITLALLFSVIAMVFTTSSICLFISLHFARSSSGSKKLVHTEFVIKTIMSSFEKINVLKLFRRSIPHLIVCKRMFLRQKVSHLDQRYEKCITSFSTIIESSVIRWLEAKAKPLDIKHCYWSVVTAN